MGRDARQAKIQQIFRERAPALRRQFRRLGVPEEQIDDAIQESFIVLIRRFDDCHPGAAFGPWLRGIARYVALGLNRSRGRRGQHLQEYSGQRGVDMPPADAAAGVAQTEYIELCIEALSAEQMAVFWAVEMESRSAPEVAEALGLTTGRVHSLLRTARRRLRAHGRRQFGWMPTGWAPAGWYSWGKIEQVGVWWLAPLCVSAVVLRFVGAPPAPAVVVGPPVDATFGAHDYSWPHVTGLPAVRNRGAAPMPVQRRAPVKHDAQVFEVKTPAPWNGGPQEIVHPWGLTVHARSRRGRVGPAMLPNRPHFRDRLAQLAG